MTKPDLAELRRLMEEDKRWQTQEEKAIVRELNRLELAGEVRG